MKLHITQDEGTTSVTQINKFTITSYKTCGIIYTAYTGCGNSIVQALKISNLASLSWRKAFRLIFADAQKILNVTSNRTLVPYGITSFQEWIRGRKPTVKAAAKIHLLEQVASINTVQWKQEALILSYKHGLLRLVDKTSTQAKKRTLVQSPCPFLFRNTGFLIT